jgi:hypothetical protein
MTFFYFTYTISNQNNTILYANLLLHEIQCSRSIIVVGRTSSDVTLLSTYYTSVGQTLISRLFLCTWSSGSISGLVWTSILRRWWRFLPWMTFWTKGILKSVWRVWLDTNHGAFAISRRSFDWNLSFCLHIPIIRIQTSTSVS